MAWRVSTLTLVGLYNYDKTVLDGLRDYLPRYDRRDKSYDNMVVAPDVDFDVLVKNLLLESADREVTYPALDVFKGAVELWACKNQRVWQQLYDTTLYKYNAIWNKDGDITRTETEERNLAGSSTSERDGTETQTKDFTNTNEFGGNGTATYDTTHKVAAYNSESFVNRENDSGNSSSSNNGQSTEKQTGTCNVKNNETVTGNTTDTGTITRTYKDTEQGNIGVTMTQDMIAKQREVVMFNIYDYIIQAFLDRFCLMVW